MCGPKKSRANQLRSSEAPSSSAASFQRASAIVEDDLEHGAHGADQIRGWPGSSTRRPSAGNVSGQLAAALAKRQVIVSREHAGGADGQGIERLGFWSCGSLTGGQAHVEAAEGNTQCPGEQRGDHRLGINLCGLLFGVNRVIFRRISGLAGDAETLLDALTIFGGDAVKPVGMIVDLIADRIDLGLQGGSVSCPRLSATP